MKKLLALVLVLVMGLSIVACSTPAPAEPVTETPAPAEDPAPAPEPAPADKKVVKVGVCIYKFDDNFMTLYREELQSYMESLSNDEVEYQVTVMDGKNDQAEQTNQINTFIADGVDVLIVNLVQATSAATVIETVKAAGIPTVFINREPTADDMQLWDQIAYVGADARQSGTMQGQIILDLPNKGDINGDGKVSYVMIQGDMENIDAQYRTEFSIKALTDAGVTVDKLFEQRGEWDQAKGQELVANALAQFGDQIEVVFCNNDAMALGAYQSIVSAGRKVNENIYLVGVDALDEAVELVQAGEMTGTVLNDHIGQSHTAVDVAVKAINGETLDKNYTVDYVKVVG